MNSLIIKMTQNLKIGSLWKHFPRNVNRVSVFGSGGWVGTHVLAVRSEVRAFWGQLVHGSSSKFKH